MRRGTVWFMATVVALAVAHPAGAADFDDDGFDDLVVPVRFEGVGAAGDAGAAHVLFGTGGGVSAAGDQFWSQNSPGITNTAEPFDFFGAAWAAGDFNGDGRDDLAIGAPYENLGATPDAGLVHVLYSGSNGPSSAASQVFTQGTAGVQGAAEAFDRFGEAVAAGDVNGDGFADLAIGSPGESLGATAAAGAVSVLFGSPFGLSGTGDRFISQDTPGMLQTAEPADLFGSALASGDFDGDGTDDLAIGVPLEDLAGKTDAGAVQVVSLAGGGLSNSVFTQDTPGVPDTAEAQDQLGHALAVGDFDRDGFDDLAAGSPDESVNGKAGAGSATVLYGSAGGVTAAGSMVFTQNSPGVPNAAETFDHLGNSLAAGDFDGDGRDDLAAGVPIETIGAQAEAGAVNVLYGSAGGLTGAGAEFFSQDSPGIPGAAEGDDHFGEQLVVGDFDGDGNADLSMSAPTEDIGAAMDAGIVVVVYGASGGLSGAGAQSWTQDTPGVQDHVEGSDRFGM